MAKVRQVGNTYYGKDEDKDSMKGVAVEGRAYVAIDTSKVYFYDEADDAWYEWEA